MGGLLSLACLAICPGVKVCTHRGCTPLPPLPPGPGGVPPPDWQRAEAPVSQSFSSGWLPPPARPGLPPPASPPPLLDTLPHLSLSNTPAVGVGGWEGHVGLVQMSRGLPGFKSQAEETKVTRGPRSHIPSFLQLLRSPESPPPPESWGDFVVSSFLRSHKECKKSV